MARDSDGIVLVVISIWQENVTFSFQSECLALLEGCLLALRMVASKVIFETDSLSVFEWFQKGFVVVEDVSNVCKQTLKYFSRCPSWLLVCIRREANITADHMASVTLRDYRSCTVLDKCPISRSRMFCSS